MTIPYIKGTSETISRLLQPYNIRVAHKPTTTLRHLLTNVKDRDEPNNRQGAVYKIKCSDCQASYIGEIHALGKDVIGSNFGAPMRDSQARIHTGLHRFMEIDKRQIFQNYSETPKRGLLFSFHTLYKFRFNI